MKLNLDLHDKKIIVLTGLMGAGKTTVGVKLAEKLGFYFIDSDQEIEDQKQISIYYEGQKVGVYIPDKIINQSIILELKSKPFLVKQDIDQFWKYLKGSDYKLGFLVNFSPEKLEIKRVVYDKARANQRKSV
jgi:GxxExxY protein